MLKRSSIAFVAVFTLIAVFMSGSPAVWAGDTDRDGTWQFSLPINYIGSTDFGGAGSTSVDIHSDVGFGFGFGYNLSDNFYVGGEFTWMTTNYEVELVSADTPPIANQTISGNLDASTFQFKGQYNILSKTFTPFIGASLGWTYVDSNIPSGPSQGTCWYDPWWGYVCNSWQPTYDDTSFSYGANAGVRAELSEAFLMEFRYNVLWIDTDNGDTLDVDGYRLELGWKF